MCPCVKTLPMDGTKRIVPVLFLWPWPPQGQFPKAGHTGTRVLRCPGQRLSRGCHLETTCACPKGWPEGTDSSPPGAAGGLLNGWRPFIRSIIPGSWPHCKVSCELLISSLGNWNKSILSLMNIFSPGLSQPAGLHMHLSSMIGLLWQRLNTDIFLFNRILPFGSSLDHRTVTPHRGYWQKGTFLMWIGLSWLETWFSKRLWNLENYHHTEYSSLLDYVTIYK